MVLTDLNMPEMNGLQLVEAARGDFPAVPVVLMTALGSEEIAVEALQKGAASYVPKRNLAQDIADTLDRVVAVAQAGATSGGSTTVWRRRSCISCWTTTRRWRRR